MSKLKSNELKHFLEKEERGDRPKKKATSIYKKGNTKQNGNSN